MSNNEIYETEVEPLLDQLLVVAERRGFNLLTLVDVSEPGDTSENVAAASYFTVTSTEELPKMIREAVIAVAHANSEFFDSIKS